ncbi:hypothetical protein [Desulfoferula mesophila]|uniref:Uncharacterized protein n=1 Tax=Desulfoferula mesophila TaxID=3058419 RepID=A0AAU9EI88_9BACT|nr:hypothetical protein FAK_32580 [Desulfoferula mesophilus]
MNREEITALQQCLTVQKQGVPRPIVQVERLMQRHTPEELEAYLGSVRRDYRKKIQHLFEIDPGNPQLDHLVIVIFRLNMAIKLMRERRMAKEAA